MKVIVPLAGKGTRLLPVTRHVPKPLIPVAGRTVFDHVMDRLAPLGVEELLVITGHLKERVEEYIRSRYPGIPARFIEQKVQDGTASAINLAREWVDGPVLIVFVDTVFDADLSIVRNSDADGILWAKEVEDYQRYGVIVTDAQGYMTRIVEKPKQPISRLANIGLYYIRDSKTLFEGIDWTMARPPVKGEYYLTDAFQYMVDRGRKLLAAEVGGWYDCGKLETTLETNAHLLSHGHAARGDLGSDVEVIEPVFVGPGARVSDSTIGPNVSIEPGAVIERSTLKDSIICAGAVVRNANVNHSLIGPDAVVDGDDLDNMIVASDERAVAP